MFVNVFQFLYKQLIFFQFVKSLEYSMSDGSFNQCYAGRVPQKTIDGLPQLRSIKEDTYGLL